MEDDTVSFCSETTYCLESDSESGPGSPWADQSGFSSWGSDPGVCGRGNGRSYSSHVQRLVGGPETCSGGQHENPLPDAGAGARVGVGRRRSATSRAPSEPEPGFDCDFNTWAEDASLPSFEEVEQAALRLQHCIADLADLTGASKTSPDGSAELLDSEFPLPYVAPVGSQANQSNASRLQALWIGGMHLKLALCRLQAGLDDVTPSGQWDGSRDDDEERCGGVSTPTPTLTPAATPPASELDVATWRGMSLPGLEGQRRHWPDRARLNIEPVPGGGGELKIDLASEDSHPSGLDIALEARSFPIGSQVRMDPWPMSDSGRSVLQIDPWLHMSANPVAKSQQGPPVLKIDTGLERAPVLKIDPGLEPGSVVEMHPGLRLESGLVLKIDPWLSMAVSSWPHSPSNKLSLAHLPGPEAGAGLNVALGPEREPDLKIDSWLKMSVSTSARSSLKIDRGSERDLALETDTWLSMQRRPADQIAAILQSVRGTLPSPERSPERSHDSESLHSLNEGRDPSSSHVQP